MAETIEQLKSKALKLKKMLENIDPILEKYHSVKFTEIGVLKHRANTKRKETIKPGFAKNYSLKIQRGMHRNNLKAIIKDYEEALRIKHELESLKLNNDMPNVPQTSTVANKKDFYTFLDLLFTESIKTTLNKLYSVPNNYNNRENEIMKELNNFNNYAKSQGLYNSTRNYVKQMTSLSADTNRPEIMQDDFLKPPEMKSCDWYWVNILKPFFEQNKYKLLENSSRNIKLKVTPLIKQLLHEEREIYTCFKDLYNNWRDEGGGGQGMSLETTLQENESAGAQTQRVAAQPQRAQPQRVAALAGGKKISVKKIGVYRTKGGYFYRRYKNGKVKRISKETYKKSKKK